MKFHALHFKHELLVTNFTDVRECLLYRYLNQLYALLLDCWDIGISLQSLLLIVHLPAKCQISL